MLLISTPMVTSVRRRKTLTHPTWLIRLSADGKTEVVAKGRPFRFPHQVVLDDAGTAYISDGYSKAIWKVADSKAPEK